MVIKNRQVNFLLCLFVLFSFLHPRGFDEISGAYKTFFTLCLYFSLLLVLMIGLGSTFQYKFALNLKNCWFVVFFVLNIVLTLVSARGLNRGLQILFASPALLYFVVYEMRYAPKDFLKCLSALLLTFLLLNIPVTELIFKNYFHLMFIGHVQTASQVGLMTIFVSTLNFYIGKKKMGALLLLLAIVNMLYSKTDSSLAVLGICFIAYLLYKFKLRKILTLNSICYAVLLIGLSAFIIYATLSPNFSQYNLSFNGRNMVWSSAFELINIKRWFGYGVENGYIEIPWGAAMTYAHNQLVQLLLDGGILLTASFCLMILQCCLSINKKSKRLRFLFNTILIALLFVMIFDSTTLYCYMYVILGLIVSFKGTEKAGVKEVQKRPVDYYGKIYGANGVN